MERSSELKSLSYRNSIKESLEKEIEQVISQIEEEKRSETTLNEEIQRIEQELEKKRNKQKDKDKELLATCSRLERKLEFSQVRFDLAQNESLSLRSKIDHMRIVLASWKLKVKSLEQDIQKFRSMMWMKNKEQSKERRTEKDKLSEIHLAMSRTANERLKYTQKLEAISVLIKKDKQNNTNIRKNINENIEKLMSKKVENNDVYRVTSQLMQNSANELRNTYSALAKTRSYNSRLFDLFETIREHSKVKTETQFVNEFLNLYEENNDLSKYLLEILAEIESFEFANKKIDFALEDSKLANFSSQKKSLGILKDLNENLKKNYSLVHKNIQHLSSLNAQIENIKKVLKKCANLKKQVLGDEDGEVDEEPLIEKYLQHVDELIQTVNIYDAYEKNESVVRTSFSPLKLRSFTPEFTDKKVDIREFLTSRDPFDEYDYEEDKIVMHPDIWRQRAQAWAESSNRTKTPNARVQ